MITDGSTLPASTPAVQAAATVAAAIAQSNGVIDLRDGTGQPKEYYSKPTSTLITTKGRNAADNADGEVQAYVFNADVFNTSVLTAGGAGFEPLYNDGFDGKNINRHILCDNGGRGLRFSQITFIGKVDNTQDITVLQALNLQIQTYNVIGGAPKGDTFDVASAIRNTQFQSGILTILLDAWVNAETQVTWIVSSAATVTANFQWV